MNIRLDFISNIDPEGLMHMKAVRNLYMKLDDILNHQSIHPEKPLDGAAKRTLILAKTNLEISLQYAIKTLCLQYEIKE